MGGGVRRERRVLIFFAKFCWCVSLVRDLAGAASNNTMSAVTAEKKVASNLSVFLQRNTTKVRRN